MEEPTHAQENQFWNQLADWLLDAPTLWHGPLSETEIEMLLRIEDELRPRHG